MPRNIYANAWNQKCSRSSGCRASNYRIGRFTKSKSVASRVAKFLQLPASHPDWLSTALLDDCVFEKLRCESTHGCFSTLLEGVNGNSIRRMKPTIGVMLNRHRKWITGESWWMFAPSRPITARDTNCIYQACGRPTSFVVQMWLFICDFNWFLYGCETSTCPAVFFECTEVKLKGWVELQFSAGGRGKLRRDTYCNKCDYGLNNGAFST